MLISILARPAWFIWLKVLSETTLGQSLWSVYRSTQKQTATPGTETTIIAIALSLVTGLIIGSVFSLPVMFLQVITTKLLARRGLRKAIAAEADPARLAVLANMESRRKAMWFYVPARIFAGIDAKALLGALPQPRPLILSLGVPLPQDAETPPPPTAPGEEINLLELRQNPQRSKMLWFGAIWMTLMLGGAIAFYVWLQRTPAPAGGGISLGAFLLMLTPMFLPLLVFIGAFFITKVVPMRSAMLTPGRLEDYRFLRRFSPFNRARHQAGLLTFTPQDSILVLTEPFKRRRMGTFIRRDGARVQYRLIADDKLDPLAEVLDRWRA
jgi:hypothetical protein